jgi:hypothetical protein
MKPPLPSTGGRVKPYMLALVVTSLLLPASVTGQEPEDAPPLRAWAAGGIGPGGGSDGSGSVAATLQLAVLSGAHQFTLRGVVASPIFSNGEMADEISVLYGRALRGPLGHLSAGAGVGLTGRDPCSGDGGGCDGGRRVAVALAAEGTLRLLPVLGIGLHVFANASDFGYMGGAAVIAQLGWLPR